MKKALIIAIAGAFLASACSMAGAMKSKQAVKNAIQTHLRGNKTLSMQNFNTQIEQVNFKNDEADALAKFISKADQSNFVEVRYKLKAKNTGYGGEWEVVSSEPVSGQGMNTHVPTSGVPMPSQLPHEPMPRASH